MSDWQPSPVEPAEVEMEEIVPTVDSSITHPSHYCKGRKYEPRKVIADWGLDFNLGNVVKYIARAGRKGDARDDLLKARQYIDFELEEMEKVEE